MGHGPHKFSRRPSIIDAFPLTPFNLEEVALWCGGRIVPGVTSTDPGSNKPDHLKVPTIEGVKIALIGDYVAKNPTGDFKVVKKGEFEAKYDVDQPGPPA